MLNMRPCRKCDKIIEAGVAFIFSKGGQDTHAVVTDENRQVGKKGTHSTVSPWVVFGTKVTYKSSIWTLQTLLKATQYRSQEKMFTKSQNGVSWEF